MEEHKQSVFKRLTDGVGKGISAVFQFVVVCVILVFGVGSCTKDGKNFLSCVGILHKSPENQVTFRQFNPKSEKDRRLASSLVKIAKAAGMDLNKIKVAIAVDPHINAMTVGTDTFVFCEGLDKLSDEQLDAVMAHEAAHAMKDHSGRSSGLVNNVNTATRITGALLGQDEETQDEVASWAVNVVFAPYSRSQELEADGIGVELLKKAGYPLNAVDVMCGTLDFISKQESDTGGGFLSTHPAIPDRIKALYEHSNNVTGPLTKEQYWAAMVTTLKASGGPFKTLDTEVEDKVKSEGERTALDNIAEQDEKRIQAGNVLNQKMSEIIPPAEYAKLHAQWLTLLNRLHSALKHQLEAAKKHDLKGAEAAEAEARDAVARSQKDGLWKQFDAESKKYPNLGG